MLQVRNLSKIYNSNTALAHIDFELAADEIAFLTGHSGAGKSTLLKLIALLEKPSTGEIYFNNALLQELPETKVPFYRRQVGLIFQQPMLLPDRNVFNNVALPLVIAGVSHREMTRKVRAALAKVSLGDKENAYPNSLSGGEQQRVSIARAIVHKPALILADEPTGNLDPELSRDIMSLFLQFNQVGVGVLIATHDINLIESFYARRLVLDHGHLTLEASHVA